MWTAEDTEAALVWQEAQDDLCGGCGQPRSESMAPNGPDYEAHVLRCRACEARESVATQWQREENAQLAGAKFAVIERGGD